MTWGRNRGASEMTPANLFRRSIAIRMFALLAGMFFITYFSISAIVLTSVSAHLRSAAVRTHVDDARLQLGSVEQLFAQQTTDVRAWSRLDVMSDLETNDINGRIAHALRQMSRDYAIPGALYAFNQSGQLVAASTHVRHPRLRLPNRWKPGPSGHIRFIDKAVDPYAGDEVVAFSAAVFAGYPPRPRIGTLVLAYRWSAISTILSSANVRLLIARPDSVPIFSEVGNLSPQAVRQAFASTRLTTDGRTYDVSRVAPVAGAFPLRWKVLVVPSGADVTASIRGALEQIAFWGVVLAVPMALLTALATRRFIAPIRRLTAAAIDISHSSDTSRRVAVDRADEIGALQRAFNLMTARLQETLDERKQAAASVSELNESLQKLAMTDALTGLANRRAAEARLKEEFAAARRANASFSLAIFDLDHFKSVNDRYGHDAGDHVLQHCATVLRDALRAGDWAARWGGEEFLLVFRDADQPEACIAAERIGQALRAAIVDIDGISLTVRASGGISTLRAATRDLAQMLSEADHCLYAAKRRGRDCVVHAGQVARDFAWKTNELQEALREDRVVPAYQVIVDLATGRPVAEEVLARVALPGGRFATADEFIEAAENINLAHWVDAVIARQAIARCAGLVDGRSDRSRRAYFLNLSSQFLAQKQLLVELLQDIKSAFPVCAQTGVGGASPIVLEITKRRAPSDIRRLCEELQPLLDFGCRIAIDDFGSGFSSFVYLAELPVSFIKIEGWMVRSLSTNKNMRRIMENIAVLADGLGIITVAESVEDATAARLLREIGIGWGQGYYFGKPQCDISSRVARIDMH